MSVVKYAVLFKQASQCQAEWLIVCGHTNACGAEVTDEAAITSGSGSIVLITVEYILSKQLCPKPLT